MARKTKSTKSTKTYKGIVIDEFKIGYGGKTGTVTYKVGDVFESENKKSIDHLINTKKLK